MAYKSEVALVQKPREREKGKIKEKKPKNAKTGISEWEEKRIWKLRDPTISFVNKQN